MNATALIPGIAKLGRQLEAQNEATLQHREWERERLSEIKAEAEEIKTLATRTNGRVNAHDVELGVIKEAERQAAIIQAARIKAEEEARAKRLSWRQGLTVAATGALVGTGGLAVLYVTHVIPH